MEVPLSRPPVRANEQELWHGTMGGYTNHRCSCAECREVWTEYHHNRRRQRRELLELGALDVTHGTVNGYCNDGCRDNCPGDPETGVTCREAWAARSREKYRTSAERLARTVPRVRHDLPGVGAADGSVRATHEDEAEERVVREGLKLAVSDVGVVAHGSTVTRSGALAQPPISMCSDLGFPSIAVREMP